MRHWFRFTALASTLAIALLAHAKSAHADVTPAQNQGFSTSITQSKSRWTFSGTATQANVADFGAFDASGASQLLNYNQFDASLGTLTGVTVILVSPQITGHVQTGISSDYIFTAQNIFSLSIVDLNAEAVLTTDGQIDSTTLGPNNKLNAGPSPGYSDTVYAADGTTPASFASTSFTITTNLASYIGSGTFDMTAQINNYTLSADCPGFGCDLSSSAGFSGSLNVVYDYTAALPTQVNTGGTDIPEPLSAALLAPSLAWLAAARRHRQKAEQI